MPVITIDRLAFGGAGFGRIDGKACFVPYTAPGDVAEITIKRSKSSYSEGTLEEIRLPGASRVIPSCEFFGKCGGCNWQHVSYEEQCRQKEQIFADMLWRAARLDVGKIKPLMCADSSYGYRQRIQLKVNFNNNKLSIGFNRSGSHFVIDIADCCLIAASALNETLAGIRGLILDSGEPARIPQVDLVTSSNGQVAAIFHYIGFDPAGFSRRLAVAGKRLTVLHAISVQSGRKSSLQQLYGLEEMSYSLPSCNGGELEIHYAPDGFSQVNFPMNRAVVHDLIGFRSGISCDSILDLYCGNGNFSLPLAATAGKVTGFESYEKSVHFANANAGHNDIGNAIYSCMDSAAGLDKLVAAGECFDLVIIDPPRTGAAEVARKLFRTRASYVIYVSCDPPTLARDINILQKSGYQVLHVQPVDMFPQTYHLESITYLQATS